MNIWFLCLFSLVPFHHAGVHWAEVSVCPDYAEVLRFKNTLLEYELAHTAAEKDRQPENSAIPQPDTLPETLANTQANALPQELANTQADALPQELANTQADALPQELADTQANALTPEIVPEPTPSVPEAEGYAEIPVSEPGRLPIPDPLPRTPSAPQPLAELPQVQFANAEEPLHQASTETAPSAGTGQISSNEQNISDPAHSRNSIQEETSGMREEIPQPIRRPWGALTLSIFLLLLSLSANVFLGWQLLELRKAKMN